MAAIPEQVVDFVMRATALDTASLDRASDGMAGLPAMKQFMNDTTLDLSASESSALDKLVRGQLRPRAAEIAADLPVGSLRGAIATTKLTARALWKRDRLAPGLLDEIMDVYRAVGIDIT